MQLQTMLIKLLKIIRIQNNQLLKGFLIKILIKTLKHIMLIQITIVIKLIIDIIY